MKLSQLLAGCSVKFKSFSGDTDVVSVVSSSEKVTPGSMFIAMKGTKYDGLSAAADAASRGCAVILSDRAPGVCDVPFVICEDIRKASALIYSNLYGDPSGKMRVIAVTGTNGKTTTAMILEHILRCGGHRVGVIGTLGITSDGVSVLCEDEKKEYSMTTPNPEILYRSVRRMADSGCDTLVMEASSHALALKKTDGLHIDVGAFSNLTPEHMDFHSDMETYYRAKSRLCSAAKSFYANADDEYGRRMMREFPNVKGVSCIPESAADSDIFATSVMYRDRGFDGIEYMLYSRQKVFEIRSPMWGKNALYNTVLSSAIALGEGIPPDVIKSSVASFRGVKGRLETLCSGIGAPRVIIDYAHTPDALEKALIQVRAAMRGRGRLILVFGCGGDRDREKRPAMGRIACKLADFSIVTSDNPRNEEPADIIRMIEEGFFDPAKYTVVIDRRAAIRLAIGESRPRDVVLVCGKGHEEYIIDKRGKHFFPEREIIRSTFAEKYHGKRR